MNTTTKIKARSAALGFASALACLLNVSAAQNLETGAAAEPIIKPELERRTVVVPRIDTEDWETTLYGGLYNTEDFGSQAALGIGIAYHFNEDLFLQFDLAEATIKDSNFRNIGLAIFPNEEELLYYYDLSVGYNLFPGEFFFGNKRAFTSNLFVISGVGTTTIAKDDRVTFNLGAGFRILVTDWAALRLEARDHIYKSEWLGTQKTTHNMEWRLGVGIFF